MPAHSPGRDPRKFLLFRTDRIGDVILTLPMVEMLRGRAPEAEVWFCVREYTRELVEGYPGVSGVIVIDGPGGSAGARASIRSGGFDAAVHVFPRPDQAWWTLRAGIPVRVGTAYRWYSALFNRRVPDHRRDGTLHEATYNARLLRPFGIEPPEVIRPKLTVSPPHLEAARRVRERVGISGTDRYIVLHPGSGGSARDWQPSNFGELARELTGRGWRVVVTGSRKEVDLADEVVRRTAGASVSVAGDLSLMELAAFVSSASLFVSNSTGPLHIAAAVGTPVIGFYPPLRGAGVSRWGPLGERAVTFVPDKSLCTRCGSAPCSGNFCMDQITVGRVVDRALDVLRDARENA